MTEKSLIYTITSTNPDEYNVIRTNLQVPFGELCRLSVNNLTTKATFVLLNKNDYIIVRSYGPGQEAHDKKYSFDNEYGEITSDGFAALLNELLENEKILISTDQAGRLTFTSEHEFMITEMTYNVKMISGFYNDIFPLEPNKRASAEEQTGTMFPETEGQSSVENEQFVLVARSVGFSLSTPILYLVSNLGAKCYDNIDETYCDRKVLMRVSNSFTPGYPIVNSNAEFFSIVPVNSLSNIEFRLVDGNMRDVKLLTPLYLSVMTESIEEPEK